MYRGHGQRRFTDASHTPRFNPAPSPGVACRHGMACHAAPFQPASCRWSEKISFQRQGMGQTRHSPLNPVPVPCRQKGKTLFHGRVRANRRPPPASRAPFPTRKRHFGQIDNVKGVFSPSTLSIGGAKRLAADADRNRGVTGNANPAPSPGVACTFSHPQATFWPNRQCERSFFSLHIVDRGSKTPCGRRRQESGRYWECQSGALPRRRVHLFPPASDILAKSTM